jgi:hypothetical protein
VTTVYILKENWIEVIEFKQNIFKLTNKLEKITHDYKIKFCHNYKNHVFINLLDVYQFIKIIIHNTKVKFSTIIKHKTNHFFSI